MKKGWKCFFQCFVKDDAAPTVETFILSNQSRELLMNWNMCVLFVRLLNKREQIFYYLELTF